MPMVLVISSYVAASRVGGGIAPFVLGPVKVDPVLIPTTLLGRHPGWGKPGGGPVPVEQMAGMLEGVKANGLFGLIDIVLTGYMATPEQAEFAGWAIEEIRASRDLAGEAGPTIIVDPILGDEGPGYYVPPRVAQAINHNLVERADILAANLWEFAQLVDTPIDSLRSAEAVAARARKNARPWLVTSVASPAGVGVVYADAERTLLAETPRIAEKIPQGTGDLLKLCFVGALANGAGVDVALGQALGATQAVLTRAVAWNAPELPLAACSDVLASPPGVAVREIL
jgi:pyridoxine kinase